MLLYILLSLCSEVFGSKILKDSDNQQSVKGVNKSQRNHPFATITIHYHIKYKINRDDPKDNNK